MSLVILSQLSVLLSLVRTSHLLHVMLMCDADIQYLRHQLLLVSHVHMNVPHGLHVLRVREEHLITMAEVALSMLRLGVKRLDHLHEVMVSVLSDSLFERL